MSGTVYPVDAVDTDSDDVVDTPKYTGEMLRQTLAALCGTAPDGRPLGATSGVRPGTPTDIVSATSTAWTVTPFAGVLDVQTAAAAGPYLFAFDEDQTGTITAADSTNTRWDLLSVQLSDPAEDSTTTPKVEIVYTEGTAASSPALPSDPDRSMQLAKIVVPKSGGGSPSVVWLAPFYGPGSVTITDWNDATTPGLLYYGLSAANGPAAGSYGGFTLQIPGDIARTTVVWRMTRTAGAEEQWQRIFDGTTWQPWVQVVGRTTATSGVSAASGGTITSVNFSKSNGMVTVRIAGTMPSATASGGDVGNTTVGTITDTRFLPATDCSWGLGSGDVGTLLNGCVTTTGAFQVTSTVTAMAKGDLFSLCGTYPAANP